MNHQSIIFSKYLSEETMATIVSDEAFTNKMLQFEMALAKAQASLGIIPLQSADEISNTLSKIKIAPAELAEGTLQNGVPVITFLLIIKKSLSGEFQKHLHYGATSQDVMDTAQVLIIRDAVEMIEERINILMNALEKLSVKYGNTTCMAHTRGQQAIPITFEVKINAWVQPLQRQLQRLTEIRKRLFVIQLGGAVGTLSVYGDKAQSLVDAFSKELGLNPYHQWHTQRDNFCEFTNWLSMLTGTLGKMGTDILVMAQSEIDEVIENAEGGGKSSAMPHKNNPVVSEALVAIAKINAQLQSQLLLSMIHVNERDATAWILEWNAIPQMLINAATALNHATTIATKMKVNTEKMKANVELFLKNNKEE